MRTRRRPVLQDKTPGNTPQSAKSQRTYVAGSKQSSRSSSKRSPLGALKLLKREDPYVSRENVAPALVPPPSPRPVHVRTDPPSGIPDLEPDLLSSPSLVKSAKRLGIAPVLMQSTPLALRRRKIRLPLHRLPIRDRDGDRGPTGNEAHAINSLRRDPSPLPPSSPPSNSSFSQRFVLPPVHPRDYHRPAEVEDEDEDKENINMGTDAFYVHKDKVSEEEDPFGFFATENKLKALRAQHPLRSGQSSRKGKEPAVPCRAPLGTLSLVEPTPLSALTASAQPPSPEDEHDIDDFYLDIYSPRPGGELLTEDVHAVPKQSPGLGSVSDNDVDEDKENAAPLPAPALIPSALLPFSIAPSSSSSADPLRTPHKPRSARKRMPLPSVTFSRSGSSSSPAVSEMRSLVPDNLSSPSPSKASAARRASGPLPLVRGSASLHRASAATHNVAKDDVNDKENELPRLTGKRRRAADAGSDSEVDPIIKSRRLEELLPKRPAKRPTRTTAGRGRGRAKVQVSEMESDGGNDSNTDEDAEINKKRSTSERGRGRSRGRGRGRGKGRGAAASSRPATTRAAESKERQNGKKRARADDGEEIDPEQEEVC
ncbi:hypothetical protein AcW1_003886 [Taiwanofungus camphoratus]|nr:hypothetical protein AcW1_003886 [Antrodia cinnamomea]